MYGKVFTGFATVAAGVVISLAPAQALAEDSGSVSSGPIPESLAASAGSYWTAARMASAKPLPNAIAARAATSAEPTETAAGSPVLSEPSAVDGADPGADQPLPLAAFPVPRPYTNYPDRLNGKVFFTAASGGNFTCSATAVNSRNKSIVWTTGRCVHGGRGSTFHRNWIFVPAWGSAFAGHRPYGTWTARELWTRGPWATTSTLRQDLGAAVVNRIRGVRLVDAIGGQGMAFNVPRNQLFSAFGYVGGDQYRCNSRWLGNDFPPGVGPATMKIDCNMSAGGGGWLIRIASNGLGYVNGLNSYRYATLPSTLFGPYFGNEALSLFNAVQVRPA